MHRLCIGALDRRTSTIVDSINPAQRSENMRRIKSANTKPEILVRRIAHRMGFRFTLNRSDLPGKPDLAFAGRRKVIFVHGCFWHQHTSCADGRAPKTRTEYWIPKLKRNVSRDVAVRKQLTKSGWKTLVIWQCQLNNEASIDRIRERIRRFLTQ